MITCGSLRNSIPLPERCGSLTTLGSELDGMIKALAAVAVVFALNRTAKPCESWLCSELTVSVSTK